MKFLFGFFYIFWLVFVMVFRSGTLIRIPKRYYIGGSRYGLGLYSKGYNGHEKVFRDKGLGTRV